MIRTIPEVKILQEKGRKTLCFDSLRVTEKEIHFPDLNRLLERKFWNYPELVKPGVKPYEVRIRPLKEEQLKAASQEAQKMRNQGYVLSILEQEATLYCQERAGMVNGLSTLKQLLIRDREGYCLPEAELTDWPSVEHRCLSTTFAWYAGYGRFGFDMQLWDREKWIEFLNICSDYKMNHLNMVMYGYWPFEFDEYPESTLRGLKMRLWNQESANWVEVEFMHPNIAEEFLPQIIEYGHDLGIQFFAYIGLNSYSGGYANAHKEKRMKMPLDSKFINDFDSLCLSDETTVEYLKSSMRKIVAQGFDGIDFEESEEAFWYCNCEKCKATFWKNAKTPEETLHAANTALLKILYEELKKAKPDIVIGIRAWRQPPLVRSEELIRSMAESIPEDVVLFWAPGQYVDDREFEKWINAFGKDRIYARDTEAIGFAAGLGRLIRPFKCNGLRCEEEPITQYIEEDIRQHRGSVKMGAAGINGYLFEWYGFFMAFFAHSYFGWGGTRENEDFYHYALEAVFQDLADDIYYVMTHMFTIHESQLNIFELEFPFARNKVEEQDIPRIQEAIEEYPILLEKLKHITEELKKNSHLSHFILHFRKWEVSIRRCRVIYDMALCSLAYEKAQDEEEKRRYLLEMYALNEQEFDIIRTNYFDVNPVCETGIKSCMIPYHELKRVLHNKLYPEHPDPSTVYLGVESLGWMWC